MEAENMLEILYERISDMALTFKTLIEDECRWSTPTFYRRLKHPKLNSPVEKKVILNIARVQATEFLALIESHDEKLKKELNQYPSHLQAQINAQLPALRRGKPRSDNNL